MSVEIESEDVIRLVLQFFKENNLHHSLETLQEETSVTVNTIENRETFIQDITEGKWDTVLKDIIHLNIAPRKLIDLYEQVVIELCELRELGAARTLLRQTEPMNIMKQRQPERYLRLEHLLSRSYFDAKEIYSDGLTKEKRRQIIAQALSTEVTVVPPSRLMTLLSECATWQQHQGLLSEDTKFDVFRDAAAAQKADKDEPAFHRYSTIKFPGSKTYAECAIFSPNGQYLVTGSVDGFIEIWNHMTGKLRKDLKYQSEENLMAMDNSVICLGFSRDSELLVSGSTDGKIAVWKVQSGICQRRFSPAHSQGVTSVSFNKDGSQLLSSSYDQTVKIHDLRSGKLLKEFRGHKSFVNVAVYSSDYSRVLSGSSDGSIKGWDITDVSCLFTFHPELSNPTAGIQSIVAVPKVAGDRFAVCTKSNMMHIISSQGKTLHSFKSSSSDYVSVAMSPQGQLIYGVSEDSALSCFDTVSGKQIKVEKMSDNEVIGIISHPFSNILAVYDDGGHVYLHKGE
ncbi:WD40-repeat-containing domain protein [Phascolomyces articulosus]|uniref:WD40 repeat-containing protein SMU1 n=1 Tax=Phascolomyces articulosus TaxID=60185 RepID=A0AAD5JRC8_9FUNG|nr:WD40-repeat-containing domain protein [Phascolomyces articulosus]